jgi:hypothetical protein
MKSPIALFCIKVMIWICVVFIGLFTCISLGIYCQKVLGFSIYIGPFDPLAGLWGFVSVLLYPTYSKRFDAFFAKKS